MYSEGLKSGTIGSGTLLADSGDIFPAGGTPTFTVAISANVAAQVELQVRNAANNATDESFTFYVGATNPVFTGPIPLSISSHQRLRLVTGSLVIGSVQAAFLY